MRTWRRLSAEFNARIALAGDCEVEALVTPSHPIIATMALVASTGRYLNLFPTFVEPSIRSSSGTDR